MDMKTSDVHAAFEAIGALTETIDESIHLNQAMTWGLARLRTIMEDNGLREHVRGELDTLFGLLVIQESRLQEGFKPVERIEGAAIALRAILPMETRKAA